MCQEYSNWKASGQNEGRNFYPDFQAREPLHVILHEFLLKHDLFGYALSRVDDVYSYESSGKLESLLNVGSGSENHHAMESPASFRGKLSEYRFDERLCVVYLYVWECEFMTSCGYLTYTDAIAGKIQDKPKKKKGKIGRADAISILEHNIAQVRAQVLLLIMC